MVLKIYGDWVACVQRIACVLNEKGVPYETIPVSMAKGEHKTPQYIEKQPFGQVPYVVSNSNYYRWDNPSDSEIQTKFIQDDDGFIIYESRAVCHYIATKYADQGTPLLPTELKANTLFHQAASIEAFHFDALAIAAVNEHMYKP